MAVVGALVLGTGCRSGSDTDPAVATVVRVVDGDTVELRFGRRTEPVRLLGIDTPETVKPGSAVECFGPEASARTKELLPAGTKVHLTRDQQVRDRFDRLLLYIVRADDGLFVNRALVAEGLARPLSIAPNDAHRSDFAAVADQARTAGRGLWSACPPES